VAGSIIFFQLMSLSLHGYFSPPEAMPLSLTCTAYVDTYWCYAEYYV
jgi:hypothetical protein